MGAGKVIVNRYRGDGGHDDKCHLSLLSLQDLSTKPLCENLNLPPDEPFDFNKCGDFLHLDDYEGNIALFNLKSKELKLLPPPKLETPKDTVVFNGSGLGYDSKADDYKVVRDLTEWYCDEEDNETGMTRRLTEVYSLKSGSWKEIPRPAARIEPTIGVYVSGRCYWTASLRSNFHIVSFDFTKESFHCLDKTPPSHQGLDLAFHLVECRGSLGAIGFERSGISKCFVVWVREGRTWLKLFDTVLYGVEKPLGLKDGRYMFLEGRTSSEELIQLLVYDCITKERKEVDIYDYRYSLKVIPYVVDALPMHRMRKRGLGVAKMGISLKTRRMKRAVMKKNRMRKRDKSHSA